jgi:hypothetical protein
MTTTSYYVAVEGDNDNPGTSAEKPLKDLFAARDKIRTRRETAQDPKGGITINIMGGDYWLKDSFTLGEMDGGTPGFPVKYQAYEGQKVRLMGGELLTGFELVRDPLILERLPEEAREHVLQCDLRAAGITDFGSMRPRGFSRPAVPAHMELFYDHRRMEVARWPSEGYVQIDEPAELLPEGDDHGGQLGKLESGFYFHHARPKGWRTHQDIWIYGFWGWDWADSFERISSFDPDSGHIKTHSPFGMYGFRAGQRFYFLNILEELDRPGEYFVDTENGLLYFWPPGPVTDVEISVSLIEDPIIRIENSNHLEIRGLNLEYARGIGIQAEHCDHLSISGCRISNVGNHGLVVSDGTENTIQSCDINNTGDGGIQVSGGNRNTLESSSHRVTNNHIHHMGRWSKCNQSAVRISGVGIEISHNHIHDGPHNAITIAGNEHDIEYNHIHHVCRETGDVGAFYMGRDWTERGNRIRYNFFHDTRGYGSGSNAVYLDDCASDTLVYGNVFYLCTRATFIGGGRNQRIQNNIFIGCEPAIQIDGRGLDPKPVWQEMVHKTMKESLTRMEHHKPPYSIQYPDLKQLDPYYAEGVGIPPGGNLITKNICWEGEWMIVRRFADPSMIAVQNNMLDQDPLFVDEANMDFRLKEDSPAFEIGFKPIPFEKIGLYNDEFRPEYKV